MPRIASRGRIAPLAAVVFATLVVGLSAVSQATRGHSDGNIIGDAAGAFGLALGWLGAVTALAMTFAVLPLFGVLTASLALCSVVPRWRYPYVAYATSVLVALVAGLVTPPTWLVALALPPLAAVIADEWLIRRQTLVLDELYTASATRLPAFIGTFFGCAFIAYDHEHLAGSTALGMLIATIGTSLPLLAGCPNAHRRRQRRLKVRAKAMGRSPRGRQPWSPEDTTRVREAAGTVARDLRQERWYAVAHARCVHGLVAELPEGWNDESTMTFTIPPVDVGGGDSLSPGNVVINWVDAGNAQPDAYLANLQEQLEGAFDHFEVLDSGGALTRPAVPALQVRAGRDLQQVLAVKRVGGRMVIVTGTGAR